MEPAKQALASERGVLACLGDNIRTCGKKPAKLLTGFGAAWAVFLAMLWLVPAPPGLTRSGMAVAAVVLWATVMWVTEALPVGITGLGIPTLLILTRALPAPQGKAPMEEVFAGFTDHVVWLCLFAFMVGAVMQLLKLDRRIALSILDRVKASNVGRVIWGFFGVNIVLSFLIPAANARAATLLPVIGGITNLLGTSPAERQAKKAIVIQSMVYGSMITGVFILTAHLPNLIMVGIFDKAGWKIDYLHWMLLQFPYLGMFVLTQWWVRWHFKTAGVSIGGGHQAIRQMRQELGPMSQAEWTLLGLLALMGLAFLLGRGSPIYQLHSHQLGIIGLLGMMVLFIPGLFPFTWKQVQEKTTWGTFLLLGGALSMTSAMTKSGLAAWLAGSVHALVVGLPWWGVILTMMAGTHIMRIGMLSNVAAVAMLAPIVFAMAPQLGLHPVAFTLLVCDTDTYAYLLPTQITAAVIAYGTDTFSTSDYARAGWVCILLAMAYGLLVMAPWYALLGLPVWSPQTPWPW